MKTSVLKQISIGISSHFSALGIVFSKNFRWTLLVPIILSITIFASLYELMDWIGDFAIIWVKEQTNFGSSDFFLHEYFGDLFSGIIWLSFKIMFFFIFAWFGGQIVLILMSPVLAYLSEKTESLLNKIEHSTNAKQFVADTLRGIGIAVKNLFFQITLSIGLLLFSFIPIIGAIAPVFLFLSACYFAGFSYLDYYNECQRLTIGQSLAFIRSHKWLAITVGALFVITSAIPVIGIYIASFVALFSSVAGTIAMHKINSKK